MTLPRVYKALTMFCGLGAKTLGTLRARGPGGSRFESVGAIDVDPVACQDFETLTGSLAHARDLGQLTCAQLAELVERPDMVLMSPPCKGFSGCLPEKASAEERYQLLNALALRAVDLALETWEKPPALILLENVPRMLSRGGRLLKQIRAVLGAAGYEVNLETHDCGDWGHLAQKRLRLLLVARHREQLPARLHRPVSRGHRSMAEVLFQLPPPVPGLELAGPHHRLRRLSPINWLRLASIPAGCDWRAIPRAIHLGRELVHPALPPRASRLNGGFGVNDAARPSHSVLAHGSISNTWGSVADPRLGCSPRSGTMGVCEPSRPSPTVIGAADIHNSPAAILDPRVRPQRRGNYGVNDPARPSPTVRAKFPVRTAPAAVADPRFECTHRLRTSTPYAGDRAAWGSQGFELLGPEVSFAARGRPCHLLIEAPDGAIHRPMTEAELMLLQGIPVWHIPGSPEEIALDDPRGEWVQLAGTVAQVREHIGNAVPVHTAQAIAEQALVLLENAEQEQLSISSGGGLGRARRHHRSSVRELGNDPAASDINALGRLASSVRFGRRGFRGVKTWTTTQLMISGSKALGMDRETALSYADTDGEYDVEDVDVDVEDNAIEVAAAAHAAEGWICEEIDAADPEADSVPAGAREASVVIVSTGDDRAPVLVEWDGEAEEVKASQILGDGPAEAVRIPARRISALR